VLRLCSLGEFDSLLMCAVGVVHLGGGVIGFPLDLATIQMRSR
jgi:hypothetical protein